MMTMVMDDDDMNYDKNDDDIQPNPTLTINLLIPTHYTILIDSYHP